MLSAVLGGASAFPGLFAVPSGSSQTGYQSLRRYQSLKKFFLGPTLSKYDGPFGCAANLELGVAAEDLGPDPALVLKTLRDVQLLEHW